MERVGLLKEIRNDCRPEPYEGEFTDQIRFPLGGIGTGTVSLGGRGELRDWEIFNSPAKGNDLPFCFALLRAETSDGDSESRVLESRIRPPYESARGLPINRLSGIPRLESARFNGAYPFAYVEFHDTSVPVDVTLEAFNPLLPGDPDASGIPVAVLRYHLKNRKRSATKVSLAYCIPNPIGPDEGKKAELRKARGFRGVLLGNNKLPSDDPADGTIALAARGGRKNVAAGWPHYLDRERLAIQAFWRDFKDDGRIDAPEPEQKDPGKGVVCSTINLEGGETKEITFYLTWHFPNRTPEACGWAAPEEKGDSIVGNYYTEQYRDAWEVVETVDGTLDSLEERSRRFTKAVLESTFPPAVIEAALNNVSTLRTETCFRTADGRFFGFEGCCDGSGCCFGSCTHVWNYEQTTPFLFPSLARSQRETEFQISTDKNGFMCFRTMLPVGSGEWKNAAADGQMGCLMKLYREWKLSGDTGWLEDLWPKARKALEFCWVENGWDGDRDGVMEGAQHTTYDSELYGPNPLCQIWYLGALRAGEEMARALGENEFAGELHELFENGSQWTDDNLFNGDYYEQELRPSSAENVAAGLRLGWAGIDPSEPSNQIGDGCLVDQLLGQYVAHVMGLGYLLDPENVKTAVASIFENNHVSMTEHECLGRTFALNEEEGLVICCWPKSEDQNQMVHWFFTEFMTGFEYSAGNLMLYEGLFDEGLKVIRDVRDRYDGRKRSPWDEAECGHHYARAMTAWGALLALSGFQYDANDSSIQFLPAMDVDPFRCVWAAGGAWGTFEMNRKSKKAEFSVLQGEFGIGSLHLPAGAVKKGQAVAGSQKPETEMETVEGRTIVTLTDPITLSAGETLVVK
ncbi:MAG: GH116 family glycosyl-hydrolase [Candidatus Brocadiia bacterium]